MKKRFNIFEVIAAGAMFVLLQGVLTANAEDAAAPPIVGQMTFFYYNDLPRAAAFYEKLLAIPPEQTPAWVRLYPLTATSVLGLVNATEGTLRPGGDKSVMATVVVDGVAAVDSWYARVKSLGIPISQDRKVTKLDDQRSIYAFVFHDPEGYALEILTWTQTAKP
ncbi:MAG TPA: VOC family protein [Rhizomicrobium sp.]|nr:VOC family protein [Rhizomicrobium sp.]